MKRILTFLFLFSSLFASSQTQFLGAPNTTIVVKGNMKVDSILYLPKRSKTPTDTGALRYQISDSSLYVWTGSAWRKAKNDGTVTSVGLTMPSAFAVANSPVTTSGTLAVTATGTVAEYIRGDGSLGTLPTSGGGGGSGVNYYLNGSVSQGTIGGSTYYEMNKSPVIGAGTNFTRGTDGLIAQFITDANDPNRLLIPAGAWNFELYFSASSAGGTPSFYIELFEYDGSTFTSIASSVANPISITNGTAVSLYVASLAVPETVLTATDRLAVRVSVNVSGRTITLHTEDNNLAQVITTFSGGLVSLNGLTANDQFFATGTSGSDFNISSTSATHTFNLPTASSTVRGALSSANWTTFNNKVNISDTAAMLTNYIRHGGYGLTKTGQALSVDTAAMATRSRVQKGIDSVASVRIGGTGTINKVAIFTGTSTIGNSQITDNAGSGVNVGAKLLIRDDGPFLTGANISNVSGNFGIGTASASSFQLFSNSTNRLHITSGGDIGIGTQSPQSKLHVKGGNGSNFYVDNNNEQFTQMFFTRNGVLNNGADFLLDSTAKDFGIRTLAAIPFYISTASTAGSPVKRMTVFANGRMGINTTTDAGYQLDVSGTLRNTGNAFLSTTGTSAYVGYTSDALAETGRGFLGINGTNNSLISMRFGGTTLSGYIYGTSDSYMFASNARPIVFNTGSVGGSERMRIHNNGNISVNTTADNGINFDISGTLRSTLGANFATASGNVGIGVLVPSEKLEVVGRVRVRTIDSTGTGTAMNMLYADATGVIKKAAVPSGGGGSVTSVATGFGLSGGTITTTGTLIVDSASIATRARVQKGIDSVTTLANTKLSGTGISGYIPKWTGTATQDTSQLFQLGRNIGIGTASPTYRIHLPDAGNTSNQAMIAGSVFGSDGNGQTITPGSGAMTYYGQGGVGYLYGAQVSASGRWGVNTRSLNDATFNVDGDVKIVTIDSTSTARNMLYQDANGVIKKSAVPSGLTMADDVMTASGSWVATKDAGSGVTINNVAYTTNGTTKMVTVDGNFYIPETSWTDNAWVTVSTIPSGFRPSKTINWNSNFIVSGAEYERSDNTDFSGACDIQGQMRIRDDGTVQVNATMNTNSIVAGGTAYILIQFTQSYIIK